MHWQRPLGGIAVLAVLATVVGVVVTLAGDNQLLTAGDVQTAALATLGVVVLSLLAFVLVGRPGRTPLSTPYW